MKRLLTVQMLVLLGCGVDVPVSQVWSRFDDIEQATWNKEIASRLAPFKEPKLLPAQIEYSNKFAVGGEYGRKFVWFLDSDEKMLEAVMQKPSGLKDLCPRYMLIPNSAQAMVWTSILDALSFSETKYVETLTYAEKFKNAGTPVISTGLFQVSEASARNHGGACKGATTDKLKNADFNVLCAFQIMANQINRTGVLYYEDSRYYYWSTFSRGLNPNGFERFMGRLGQLMRSSDRWPRACGLPNPY